MKSHLTVVRCVSILIGAAVAAVALAEPSFPPEPSRGTPEHHRWFLALYQGGVASNTPIEFHGRVIDQDGRGVEGVEVKASLRQFNESVIDKYPNIKSNDLERLNMVRAVTDNEGRFSYFGLRGLTLSITSVSRDGIHCDPRASNPRTFWTEASRPKPVSPSDHVMPTRDDPHLIHVWRKGTPVPLHKNRIVVSTQCDGRPNDFSFTASDGGKDEPVDLRIRLDTVSRSPFTWTYTIECPDGGVQPTKDYFYPYRAPDQGYVPSYTLPGDKQLGPRGLGRCGMFYVKSRGGKLFGSVSLENISAHPDGSAFIAVRYLANPNGSTSLEYDRSLRINKSCQDDE